MKLSHLFTKTSKTAPKDADSANAKLFARAGYIHQEMAGVYSFLPLGLRVLTKIEQIIREEMTAVGGQEVLMPALSNRSIWEATNRWDKMEDIMYRLTTADDKEFALNSTHEEIVTPIAKQYASSYKDLPVSIYQIQSKFRKEPRAKSGLLRGREFRMKDMYSFARTEEEHQEIYDQVAAAYHRIFERCGLGDITYYTHADGGVFTDKNSHEFQTENDWGEDTVYLCSCGVGHNEEIVPDLAALKCLSCGGTEFRTIKATEVGNIFPLETQFADAFDYQYIGEDGKPHPVIMGCYGIGSSRVMGVVAEVLADDNGLVWPKEIAPFVANIIPIGDAGMQQAEELYAQLQVAGVDVLLDDRDMGPGAKFADNDLLGIPYRVVISDKTIEQGKVECKERTNQDAAMITVEELRTKLG